MTERPTATRHRALPTTGAGSKLLITASGDLWAGAAVQVRNVVKELVSRDRFVLRAAVLNGGRLERELRSLGVATEVFDERRRSSAWIVRRLRGVLAEFAPEIVHLNDYKLQVLVSAARLTLPSRLAPSLVRTYHSRPSRWRGLAGAKVGLFHRLDTLSLKYATDCVIAVSRDLAGALAPVLGEHKVAMVPNGVRAPSAAAPPGEVRARFGIPEGRTWIATGIRLEEIKAPDILVDAAAVLMASGVPFVMSIFGSGRLESALRASIAARGLGEVVRLHGECDDLPEIMPAWDLFVLSSRHEGMPMVLLEAMAAGVTPVCTRVGGVTEIVEDGVSGALVAPGSGDALASALRPYCLDSSLRRNTSLAAARRIEAGFSVASTVDRYCEIYDGILSDRRRR